VVLHFLYLEKYTSTLIINTQTLAKGCPSSSVWVSSWVIANVFTSHIVLKKSYIIQASSMKRKKNNKINVGFEVLTVVNMNGVLGCSTMSMVQVH
jgi:hypothetical protein